MLSKEDYLQNPCRATSIPYWKEVSISVPENIYILHADDFSEELLVRYTDVPYFRLKHDLQAVEPMAVPEGYALCRATAAEFAAHIHECYGNAMTVNAVVSFTERAVYCPSLWLALRDLETGRIVATGIGELDIQIGEGALEWIQVSASHRRRGLGHYLVRELLWRLKDIARFATVSGQCNNSTDPESLYRSCGFTGHDIWHILSKR